MITPVYSSLAWPFGRVPLIRGLTGRTSRVNVFSALPFMVSALTVNSKGSSAHSSSLPVICPVAEFRVNPSGNSPSTIDHTAESAPESLRLRVICLVSRPYLSGDFVVIVTLPATSLDLLGACVST